MTKKSHEDAYTALFSILEWFDRRRGTREFGGTRWSSHAIRECGLAT
jgi:hypothetical protein